MKTLICGVTLLLAFYSLQGQQNVKADWNCNPVSYEATPTKAGTPAPCDIVSNTTPTKGWFIRIGVYSKEITGPPNTFSLEIEGKFYYYYDKCYLSKADADKANAAMKAVYPKTFCTSIVVPDPIVRRTYYQ